MKRFISILVALYFIIPVFSQGYQWWPEGSYDPRVPTPGTALGYEIGSYLTDHWQMLDYIRQLQETSERVRLFKYGQSVEKRDMYLLIFSSPSNLARVEDIRQSIQKLADPRICDDQEAERIIESVPPIAWINFANDGGETAAFEAGIQLAYQLAAGTDEFTRQVLDKMVVIINTAANPDSHQRFVAWMKAVAIGPEGTADPYALEHNVPWYLSSDGNHYLIDSNRDAFALTQVETQAVAKALHHWKPQVWVDNHGEPDEYYFAPFCAPMNRNYPDALRKWATELGKLCAANFDRMGWSYAKEDTYDLFYPGYWDSYPALNGAVSATFETNGGGWKHLSWERPDGSISTLRLAVHGHFMADMATLRFLFENSRELLRYFREFHAAGMAEVKNERVKGYILFPGPEQKREIDLVTLLLRHEIEVYQIGKELAFERGRRLMEETAGPLDVPPGSIVIPLEQPNKRLVKALFEPDPQMEGSFLAEVERLRKVNRNLGARAEKERLGFYDVTSWSLPLLFGLDAAEIESEIAIRGDFRRIDRFPHYLGRVERKAEYAYLFAAVSDAGNALAGRLLQEGFHVGVATRSFENSGRSYQPGDFVVKVERNPEALHQRIKMLAEETGAEVWAVDSAWSDRGISLGSDRIVNLEAPRIMVFTDSPTRAVEFGSVYSLLEQRFGLKFTAIGVDYFRDVDLSRYNVIVLPGGSAAGYRRILGPEGWDRLIHWIRDGGVAIGLKEGARYFTMEEDSPVDVSFVSTYRDSEEGPEQQIEMHPGSIFRAEVLTDYYLGYGYAGQIPVQVRGNLFMTPTSDGVNAVSFPAGSHIGGQQWEYTEKALEGKSYLADIPIGGGHVLLFAEDCTFRSYWRGLDKLFINGVILGPSF